MFSAVRACAVSIFKPIERYTLQTFSSQTLNAVPIGVNISNFLWVTYYGSKIGIRSRDTRAELVVIRLDAAHEINPAALADFEQYYVLLSFALWSIDFG
jgi:hypothetical protein